MNTLQIDKINLGLIVISFTLACLLPFELFLVSYAVLGPLHYLTETNWIADKNYFVPNTLWKYVVLVSAIIYTTPYLFSLTIFRELLNDSTLTFLTITIRQYTNGVLFFVLVSAVLSLVISSYKAFMYSFILVLIISFFTHTSPTYGLIFGILLPTIIHVFVFTVLFMVYGLKKATNWIGVLNVVLMFLLPLSLWFINTDVFHYEFSQTIKNNYLQNNFHVLNAHLAKLLGAYDELKFFFYEKVDLKIQIFIAFAYLYHYLNWFSKTTVIGWHKKLTKKKSVIILGVWLLVLASYLYDYRVGIICSVFLSVIHVMFEFPLNVITVKTLVKK
ncbi:hypothetical protein [Mangrovimonas cancribranchiae]|uniref:Beta-carotene 15,15'-monooxygenase n=1 Tax=Mangrovimonas cancribranchiae TaxID=3080055 RepID=A0AAU6P076_9FLAO